MSFIRDYFNHEKTVQRRLEQLEAINRILVSRSEEVGQAEASLNELNEKIVKISSLFPELSDEEALKKYFTTLKQQNDILEREIASRRKQLENLFSQLQLAQSIKEMQKEAALLTKELDVLKMYKSQTIKVENIMFAGYFLSDNRSISFSAFEFLSNTTYTDDEDEECCGYLYKSIGGNRIIGFDTAFSFSLRTTHDYYNEEDGDDIELSDLSINTRPEVWLTFADACLAIKSDVYLNGIVTISDINDILNAYLTKYKIVIDENEGLIIIRRRRKPRK